MGTNRFWNKRGTPVAERFWQKVAFKWGGDECWEWQADRNWQGYGRFHSTIANREPAHRVSYRLVYGPYDTKWFVLHRCDNPSCVRPDHLFLGDHEANQKDKMKKGRGCRGESHGMSKLSEETVREIRASSAPDKELAKQFGIEFNYVNAVRNRRVWKHLD